MGWFIVEIERIGWIIIWIWKILLKKSNRILKILVIKRMERKLILWIKIILVLVLILKGKLIDHIDVDLILMLRGICGITI